MIKQIFILLFSVSILASCKNETKPVEPQTKAVTVTTNSNEKTAKQSDGLTLLKGEFIYYADAAVLQVGNSIFGVVVDEKMHELHELGKPHRKATSDGVMVEVRGKIIPKAEGTEGWPFKVEIKEILGVKKLDSKQNEVVKIGK